MGVVHKGKGQYVFGDATILENVTIKGATSMGDAVADTFTYLAPIVFTGGTTAYFKMGTLSSTTPGSGIIISATLPRAMDVHVDDNNTAIAQGTLLSAARFRMAKYETSITEDYAVHGLTKYIGCDHGGWGAGVMGAVETSGTVALAGQSTNLMSGVIGRFGTSATLNTNTSNDRIACVTAFNNNSVSLTGSGKSVGFLVMEAITGTPVDLDYGIEVGSSVCGTGLYMGTATTGINLAGTFTTGLTFAGTLTNAINFSSMTAGTATDGTFLKAGTLSVPVALNTAGAFGVKMYVSSTSTSGGLTAARFRALANAASAGPSTIGVEAQASTIASKYATDVVALSATSVLKDSSVVGAGWVVGMQAKVEDNPATSGSGTSPTNGATTAMLRLEGNISSNPTGGYYGIHMDAESASGGTGVQALDAIIGVPGGGQNPNTVTFIESGSTLAQHGSTSTKWISSGSLTTSSAGDVACDARIRITLGGTSYWIPLFDTAA